jgi:hypothetical protein
MIVAAEPADWLWRASTGRNALIAAVLSAAIFGAFAVWARVVHLPGTARIGLPGRRPADEIASALRALDAVGRRYYLWSTLTLDLLLPIAYSLTFSFAAGALLRTLGATGPLTLLRFLPFAAAAADYAEDAFIVLFTSGRKPADEVARALAVLTPAKWWLIYLSAAVVAFLGLGALIRHR